MVYVECRMLKADFRDKTNVKTMRKIAPRQAFRPEFATLSDFSRARYNAIARAAASVV
jgi:hypothetical protein